MKQDNRLEHDNLLSVFLDNVKKSILFIIKNKVILKRIISFVFSVFVSLFEICLIFGLFFILRNGSSLFQKILHHQKYPLIQISKLILRFFNLLTSA